ncbi:hypothetical protein DFH09DRAFT_1368067 [Mycena vulgaris]|nr:hypothetical protein DFH09DRAFT_1368067 [Mycena vulgaris]
MTTQLEPSLAREKATPPLSSRVARPPPYTGRAHESAPTRLYLSVCRVLAALIARPHAILSPNYVQSAVPLRAPRAVVCSFVSSFRLGPPVVCAGRYAHAAGTARIKHPPGAMLAARARAPLALGIVIVSTSPPSFPLCPVASVASVASAPLPPCPLPLCSSAPLLLCPSAPLPLCPSAPPPHALRLGLATRPQVDTADTPVTGRRLIRASYNYGTTWISRNVQSFFAMAAPSLLLLRTARMFSAVSAVQ